MVEITTIEVCLESGEFWTLGEEPGCVDPAHEHLRHDRHRHRTPVTLPDGTTVVAVSFEDAAPYQRDQPPDFGVYLDERWNPPWPHEHIDWPDFGVPADPGAVAASLREALERARSGEVVEIGCLGAHGRTGTALALLAILAGHPADDAVAWVRRTYCDQSVETDEQADFAARIDT
jgi:protein-tyrosine phosphatase